MAEPAKPTPAGWYPPGPKDAPPPSPQPMPPGREQRDVEYPAPTPSGGERVRPGTWEPKQPTAPAAPTGSHPLPQRTGKSPFGV
jgi:hypothetical protein